MDAFKKNVGPCESLFLFFLSDLCARFAPFAILLPTVLISSPSFEEPACH